MCKSMNRLTNIRPKIRNSLHLDIQIPIHLANNLDCMSDCEMRLLSLYR